MAGIEGINYVFYGVIAINVVCIVKEFFKIGAGTVSKGMSLLNKESSSPQLGGDIKEQKARNAASNKESERELQADITSMNLLDDLKQNLGKYKDFLKDITQKKNMTNEEQDQIIYRLKTIAYEFGEVIELGDVEVKEESKVKQISSIGPTVDNLIRTEKGYVRKISTALNYAASPRLPFKNRIKAAQGALDLIEKLMKLKKKEIREIQYRIAA